MTLWIARHGTRMVAVFLAMLLVEFGSYFFAFESGVNRMWWVPVSFGLVAYAGYDTVRRMPLLWGVVVGAVLAGLASIVSLFIGTYASEGQLRLPVEADPLLLFTTLLMTSLIGAIVAGAAGVVARARRRQRARRTAIRKLAYTAMDEPSDKTFDMTPARTAVAEPRVEHPLPRAAEGR